MKRMKFLSFISLLISFHAVSQDYIKTGEVKSDKSFNCSSYTFVPEIYGQYPYIDSVYGIQNICGSKNDIEIRFAACHGPMPVFEIIILSLKDGEWAGKRFDFYMQDYLDVDSARNADAKKIIVYPVKASEGFDELFKKLKSNNIFSLPDFKEVKNKPHGPVCGTTYSVTYKAGNDLRTYSFQNADYYIQHSKRKIFQNYFNIAEILSKELVKE